MQDAIQPGYMEIQSIVLSSPLSEQKVDISRIIEEFTIFENIMQPFMTINILISDATSLFTLLPLTGDEYIEIGFGLPHPAYQDKPFKASFRVISLKDVVTTTQVRNVRYILRGIQPEAFKDWTSKVRKSYANQTISTMAKAVAKDYLGISDKLTIEDSVGTRTIVIPTMTPTKALKFLAREAKSSSNVPSNYVWFSNADGFHFVTVDSLMKKTPTDKYFLVEKNYTPNGDILCDAPGINSSTGFFTLGQVNNAVRGKNKPFEFMRVNDYVFKSMFDLENNLRRGSFDTTIFAIDTQTCKFTKKTYNYKKDYGTFERADKTKAKYVHEKSQLNDLQGESHMRYFFSDHDSNKINPDQKPDFLHFLAGSVAMLDYVNLELNVPGDPTRRVGDVVRVGFPEFSAFDDTIKEENAFLSGDYLVTGVKHSYAMAGEGYSCTLQLMKNSYHKTPEASKKDLMGKGSQGGGETPDREGIPTTPAIPSN